MCNVGTDLGGGGVAQEKGGGGSNLRRTKGRKCRYAPSEKVDRVVVVEAGHCRRAHVDIGLVRVVVPEAGASSFEKTTTLGGDWDGHRAP